ncbi:MAG: branched-chain amino acid transaminase [Anaerolineae bacterium]|nr:branched-chain amino acid transaminase [Anaerolineae bacterium]
MSARFDYSTTPPRYVWLNGRLVPFEEATVPVTAMGASGGLAVFEGIKAYWNPELQQLYVFRLDAHLRRLYQSMKIVRMAPAASQEDLRAATLQLLRANGIREDTYIRPVAFYDGVKLPSFRYTVGAPPDLCLSTMGFRSHLGQGKSKACAVSSWIRVSDNQCPPRVKVMSNYQNNRLAFLEAHADGYDDAIILDDRGKVTEAAAACLFMVREGVVTTSPVTHGILESVTRDVVIRLCREALGLPVAEREIDRTELYVCEEVFLCGTGEEVTAVTSVDRLPVGDGSPGPIFAQVERLYHDLVRGLDPRYPEWRTPVYRT